MKSILTLLALFLIFSVSAQKDASTIFEKTITPAHLKTHATIIASNSNEGRETGTSGIQKARNYIIKSLKKFGAVPGGLKDSLPSFEQEFNYRKESWAERLLIIKDDTLDFRNDYFFDISTNPKLTKFETNRIIFLGYGIDSKEYNDYAGINIRGKVILIQSGEPVDKHGNSFITKSKTKSEWAHNDLLKLETAKRRGAKMVLIINDKITTVRQKLASGWIIGKGLKPDHHLPCNAYITTSVVQKIYGKKYKKLLKCQKSILKKGKPEHFSAKTKIYTDINVRRAYLTGKNILTLIEGSDEKLKNEYIFLTAHYDHLGKKGDKIYNGADDNGSGSSALLEITRAFTKAKKNNLNPKRSVVVMWVAGEEKGLLGSNYYVENPIYPLENTVAEVNMDMIGRMDEAHEGNTNYVYTIGSDMLSTGLDSIVRLVNKTYVKLELDFKYNKKDDPKRYYYRSDHYNFARHGIPSVFYFDGGHHDYHRPSDTIEKLNFELLSKRARLAFHTLWSVANQEERLKLDVTPE